ncbi:unnamed protein product [Gadus morhua 'NCC']
MFFRSAQRQQARAGEPAEAGRRETGTDRTSSGRTHEGWAAATLRWTAGHLRSVRFCSRLFGGRFSAGCRPLACCRWRRSENI